MNAHGRMIRVDSHPAPPPPDPPGDATIRHRAEMDIIDELAIHNVRLAAENYRVSTREAVYQARIEELETALQGIFKAVDNEGLGMTDALRRARSVMRR